LGKRSKIGEEEEVRFERRT